MLGRQAVGPSLGVEGNDPGSHHHRQPFADVALGERRLLGDLSARRRRQCGHRVEEAGAVADPDHDGDGAVVDEARHAVEECVRRGGVEVGRLDVLRHVSLQGCLVSMRWNRLGRSRY